MTDISKHGIHHNISRDDYHKYPALSASACKTLATADIPARYKWKQDYPKTSDALNFGTAAHLLFLEGRESFDKSFMVYDGDLRLKDDRAIVKQAQEQGLQTISAVQFAKVEAMVDVLEKSDLRKDIFRQGGTAEVMLRWQKDNIERKALIDYLPPEPHGYFADYKTTASVESIDLQRSIRTFGYHQQMAFYNEGLIACGIKPKAMLLVFQEKEPPYPIRVVRMTERQLIAGEVLNAKAASLYEACTGSGDWGSYDRISEIELPEWYYQRIENDGYEI